MVRAPACVPTAPTIAALDRLGDAIAELSAHLEAATARLLAMIREFDARGGWNTGFTSCAAWLSWRVGLDLGAARERVRVARSLATLPRLADALARGELSYAKVRALTRVATPETEARLLTVGRSGTAAHVERIARGWRRVDRKAEANLALLCHRHHRAVHEMGYTVERRSDGSLRFGRPDGRELPEVPAPASVPADAPETLRARNVARGLAVDARTLRPDWLGEKLDLGWAIDVLHPLAQRAGPRSGPHR